VGPLQRRLLRGIGGREFPLECLQRLLVHSLGGGGHKRRRRVEDAMRGGGRGGGAGLWLHCCGHRGRSGREIAGSEGKLPHLMHLGRPSKRHILGEKWGGGGRHDRGHHGRQHLLVEITLAGGIVPLFPEFLRALRGNKESPVCIAVAQGEEGGQGLEAVPLRHLKQLLKTSEVRLKGLLLHRGLSGGTHRGPGGQYLDMEGGTSEDLGLAVAGLAARNNSPQGLKAIINVRPPPLLGGKMGLGS